MPPNQLNEQEIQFKKRARRRLVGAIALVLLMVTVLPMVLDDRATKTPQQEIAITIPSQDGAEFTSKIVPVAPEAASPSSSAEVTPAPQAESMKPEEATSGKTAEEAVAIPKPEASKTETLKTEPAQKAPVENKPIEPNSSKGDEFSVQIGVFSDLANVKQLQQKLSLLGYKSYTEKLATDKGEKIRLRAGPFTARSDAEIALGKIKESGLAGMVVSK